MTEIGSARDGFSKKEEVRIILQHLYFIIGTIEVKLLYYCIDRNYTRSMCASEIKCVPIPVLIQTLNRQLERPRSLMNRLQLHPFSTEF